MQRAEVLCCGYSRLLGVAQYRARLARRAASLHLQTCTTRPGGLLRCRRLKFSVINTCVRWVFVQYRARLARRAAFLAGSLPRKLGHQREAEALLRRCLTMDPTDGRGYVGLGKLLVQQRRCEEARRLYDEGVMATGVCPFLSGNVQEALVTDTEQARQ